MPEGVVVDAGLGDGVEGQTVQDQLARFLSTQSPRVQVRPQWERGRDVEDDEAVLGEAEAEARGGGGRGVGQPPLHLGSLHSLDQLLLQQINAPSWPGITLGGAAVTSVGAAAGTSSSATPSTTKLSRPPPATHTFSTISNGHDGLEQNPAKIKEAE